MICMQVSGGDPYPPMVPGEAHAGVKKCPEEQAGKQRDALTAFMFTAAACLPSVRAGPESPPVRWPPRAVSVKGGGGAAPRPSAGDVVNQFCHLQLHIQN